MSGYAAVQDWRVTLLEERLNRELRLARILLQSGDTSARVQERIQRHRENAAAYEADLAQLQVPT